MKTYQCHKKVQAAKITSIIVRHGRPHLLMFAEGTYVEASDHYMDKHKPEVGGYFVQYEDGYQSFSPAKAFEDGYTKVAE